MNKIVGLDGKPAPVGIRERSPLAVLREVVEAIQKGELELEQVFIVGIATSKRDSALITHPTWDTGLTVAEVVYMMETVKQDLFDQTRGRPK